MITFHNIVDYICVDFETELCTRNYRKIWPVFFLQVLIQPPRNQFKTNRRWSPAWLASWLPFDIVFPSPFPLFPRPISSFSFLPRRKLFTRRIFVARNESGGYLLSIDRFWNHAKSFRPSSRGLLLSLSFSLYFLFLFFAPFSHYPHFFFDPERIAITGVFSSFIVPMRSLCHLALHLIDALLFCFFPFPFCLLSSLVILSRKSLYFF